MLNRELIRVRQRGSTIEPQLIGSTPAVVATAQAILDHWRGSIGKTLGDSEDAQGPILHGSRSLVLAKGLAKLVLDGCTLAEATSAAALRATALAASAAAFARLAATPEAHRHAVAAILGMDPAALAEALYADLPDRAVLQSAPDWTAAELLARYNLSLCQGLLLTAREVRVTLPVLLPAKASGKAKAGEGERDIGQLRRLFKALRWHRLLATVTTTTAGTVLDISGPDAVLDQASRYGVNLANFLVDVASGPAWKLEARVRAGKERTWGDLVLDDSLGLQAGSRFLAYVPAEAKALEEQVRTALAGVAGTTLVDPPILTLPGGELVVCDLGLRRGDQVLGVELFHRWHHTALGRRLEQASTLPGLILGVDRAIAKRPEHAGLADDPRFAGHGFLFSDLPTAKQVLKVVDALPGSGSAIPPTVVEPPATKSKRRAKATTPDQPC